MAGSYYGRSWRRVVSREIDHDGCGWRSGSSAEIHVLADVSVRDGFSCEW